MRLHILALSAVPQHFGCACVHAYLQGFTCTSTRISMSLFRGISHTGGSLHNLLYRCRRAQAAPFQPASAFAPRRWDWIWHFQSPPSYRLPPVTPALLSSHQCARGPGWQRATEGGGAHAGVRPAASEHAGVASSSGLAAWQRAVRLGMPSAKGIGRPLPRGPLCYRELTPDSALTARGMGMFSSCPGDTDRVVKPDSQACRREGSQPRGLDTGAPKPVGTFLTSDTLQSVH